MTTIDGGIPCTIRSQRIRDAIRQVFAAIQRHPRDWARLRRRRAWHRLDAAGG
jgi:hypothetical protein